MPLPIALPTLPLLLEPASGGGWNPKSRGAVISDLSKAPRRAYE